MAVRWNQVLGFTACLLLTAIHGVAEEPPPIVSLILEQPLQFQNKEGADILLPAGQYRVDSAPEHQLQFVSEASPIPVLIEAVELPHEKDLTVPAVGTLATDEDSVHVVLFMPGGTALDAIGSRSGVRTRAGALTSTQLSQVQIAPSKVNTLVDAAKASLLAEQNSGAKSHGFLPSCVQSRQGIECFIQSMAAPPSLLTAVFAGGKWSPWTSLGGSIISEPSCFNPGPGFPSSVDNISCIALGLNSRLWLLKKANGQWTTNWQSIDFGANIHASDGISCVNFSVDARIAHRCYARNKMNVRDHDRMYSIGYSDPNRPEDDGWGKWQMVYGVGPIHSKPECLITYVPSAGRYEDHWNLHCYGWRSGQLVRTWETFNRWSSLFPDPSRYPPAPPPLTGFSGQIAAPPSCAEKGGAGPNFVVCAALKADGSLVFRRAINPDVDRWQSVAGSDLAGPPICLSGGTCFAVGKDQKLWRFDLGDAASPARSARIPGSRQLMPRLTCIQAGNIHCFAVAMTTNDLIHYQITP